MHARVRRGPSLRRRLRMRRQPLYAAEEPAHRLPDRHARRRGRILRGLIRGCAARCHRDRCGQGRGAGRECGRDSALAGGGQRHGGQSVWRRRQAPVRRKRMAAGLRRPGWYRLLLPQQPRADHLQRHRHLRPRQLSLGPDRILPQVYERMGALRHQRQSLGARRGRQRHDRARRRLQLQRLGDAAQMRLRARQLDTVGARLPLLPDPERAAGRRGRGHCRCRGRWRCRGREPRRDGARGGRGGGGCVDDGGGSSRNDVAAGPGPSDRPDGREQGADTAERDVPGGDDQADGDDGSVSGVEAGAEGEISTCPPDMAQVGQVCVDRYELRDRMRPGPAPAATRAWHAAGPGFCPAT
jgi:hypothetical protein